MSKIAAFSAAFIATLVTVLLPVRGANLFETGAQSGGTQTEQVVYEILSGLQKLGAGGAPLPSDPPHWITSVPSIGHERAFDLIIAGELEDLNDWRKGQFTANQPVYSVIKHVSGDNAELTARLLNLGSGTYLLQRG